MHLERFVWFQLLQRSWKWSEIQLERFKNQQLLTKGVRTPLSLDPHPPQPWPFGSWHIIDVSYSYLYLTFYKDLCMVWITTIALKSGLKMHVEKLKIRNFPTQGKWTPLRLDPIPCSLGPLCLGTYHIHYWCSLFQPFIQSFVWFLITTKALKSGLKMHLARFKNRKFSYPGKGDIPSLGSPSNAASALFA